MSQARIVEGRWWIHGSRRKPHYGFLRFDPRDGLELKVSIAEPLNLLEIFQGKKGRSTSPSRVYGEDQHGVPITLFGCTAGRSASAGLEVFTLYPDRALLNSKQRRWSSSKFAHVRVDVESLDAWLDRAPRFAPQKEGTVVSMHIHRQPDICIQVNRSAEMRIAQEIRASHGTAARSYSFKNYIWFHFRKPVCAQHILVEYVEPIVHLLAMLTGDRVAKRSVQFFENSPFEKSTNRNIRPVELLLRGLGVDHTANLSQSEHTGRIRITFREIAGSFPLAVKTWFACKKKLQPVVDLYSSIARNPDVPFSTRFLHLAQALEVYHSRCGDFRQTETASKLHKMRVKQIAHSAPQEYRKWIKEKLAYSNQKTLARRLEDIAASIHPECKKLTASIPDFFEKVRHTRNYYTHYSKQLLKKGKVAEEAEFLKLTFATQAILEICLFKKIGLSAEPISRILQHYEDIVFLSVDPEIARGKGKGTSDQDQESP